MKLPKTLLSAILIGIVVQAASSCGKDKDIQDQKAKTEEKKEKEKNNPPYNCPACGMG